MDQKSWTHLYWRYCCTNRVMGVIVICSQLYNTLKASVPGLRAVIIISLRYSGLLLLCFVCVCVISVSLAQV